MTSYETWCYVMCNVTDVSWCMMLDIGLWEKYGMHYGTWGGIFHVVYDVGCLVGDMVRCQCHVENGVGCYVRNGV